MIRYIFVFPYDGDPTAGPTVPTLPAPLDKAELVQPDSGALYPDPPADSVLVGLGCNALDTLNDALTRAEALAAGPTPSLAADVDAYNAAVQGLPSMRDQIAAIRAELLPQMDAAAASLVADGFVQVGVSDVL